MAWTTPRTWGASELVTANINNTHIRDNFNYLLSGRQIDFLFDSGSASTSSTSYVDIDGTNLIAAVAPASSRIMVWGVYVGSVDNTAGNGAYIRIHADNSGGDSSAVFVPQNNSAQFPIIHLFTGLSPGTTYTFSLQYKAVTGTIYANNFLTGCFIIALEV